MKKKAKPATNRPDLAGQYVYFARGTTTKLIKIGHSQNPSQRAVEMQTGSGEELKIILTLPGTRRDERKMHVQFRVHRERGEWFREEGRLHAFLKERDIHHIDVAEPVISVAEIPRLELLQGVVRGFCTTKEARQALLDFGLKANQIYLRGDGAEDIGPCLGSFRGNPGWIVLAQDLRVFGDTKKDITKKASEIERAYIRLYDITHPEDGTYTALVHRAHAKVAGTRFEKDPKRAHRMGRRGGEVKGIEQALKRDAILRAEIVRRIVLAPELTWERRMQILGEGFSQSTLRRQFLKEE